MYKNVAEKGTNRQILFFFSTMLLNLDTMINESTKLATKKFL